jgi:ferric-dicitrate binding protein FerR (iron transport regulator)
LSRGKLTQQRISFKTILAKSESIEELFSRYLRNECTDQEVKQLFKLFDNPESEEQLKNMIRAQLEMNSSEAAQHLLEATLSKIRQAIGPSDAKYKRSLLVTVRENRFYLAAAALLVFVALTVVFWPSGKKQNHAVSAIKNQRPAPDIAPGSDNAILTLGDGTRIVLNKVSNGTLVSQGGVKVLKLNGQITYQPPHNSAQQPVYNTITTAKGNQYELILCDGSKVWLNASSSIRFPVVFSGSERKVEITGEAYFEVTKNPLKPFKVAIHSGMHEAEVEVLGTHFNVNAYDDEPDVKTTLLEGSVRIKNESAMKIISPGQQARFSGGSGISVQNNVDLAQVIAWKQGYFSFDNIGLRALMRQVARWYDVDIQFADGVTDDGFTGKISRSVPLSRLLEVLEFNDIHVTVEGRKIMIKP